MRRKLQVIKHLLSYRYNRNYLDKNPVTAFAPANIALCKYWGKRDEELNLPMSASLSLALGQKGSTTTIAVIQEAKEVITLNNKIIDLNTPFATRLIDFLDLFRPTPATRFRIDTINNIPTSAGNASSASGFAALTLALNDFFSWNLDKINLSILARLGSGSACRSFWPGFVKWQAGIESNGMDSYGALFPFEWPNLRIGLLTLSTQPKKMSSRDAMRLTIQTCPLYETWPAQVEKDLRALEKAIIKRNFELLGKTAESNALALHAMLLKTAPPILYSTPETIAAIRKIWALRAEGLPVYFTQDAGPNIQLLFLEKDTAAIQQAFPKAAIIDPFEKTV